MAKKIELAKAYVQIIPTTRGVKDKLQTDLSKMPAPEIPGGGVSGGKFASAFMGGFTTVAIKAAEVAAVAIAATMAGAIKEGAALQQSLGGIETMFGEHAGTIKKYATEAYKTAGVSANKYMEQVTSFSATLIQSLGGDTAKAAEVANMAMIDMSDNANKFGTDIESIQMAYQGFAKGNFTMLDNLKLGYGGTKEEMQRLIDKANELRQEQGLNADLTIDSFADISTAIHTVQEDLGIAGTTGKEAAETISGSWASLKASFQNFLGALALGEESGNSVKDALYKLFDSAGTFVKDNLLPVVQKIMTGLGEAFTEFIDSGGGVMLGEMAGKLIGKLVVGLIQNAPKIIVGLMALLQQMWIGFQMGLAEAYLKGVETLVEWLKGLWQDIKKVGETAAEIMRMLWDGIKEKFQNLVDAGKEALQKFIDGIKEKIENAKEKGREIVDKLKAGIIGFIPNLITTGRNMISNLLTNIRNAFSGITSIGRNLVEGLWRGINNAKKWVLDKIKGFGRSILNGLKSFFGIHSPSRLFEDEIGTNLALGIGVGFTGNIDQVRKDMEKSLPTTLDAQSRIKMDDYNINTQQTRTEDLELIYLLKELLFAIKNKDINNIIDLDGKTIATIIYPLLDALMGKDARLQLRGV